jgi:hypothetical protein
LKKIIIIKTVGKYSANEVWTWGDKIIQVAGRRLKHLIKDSV